MKFGNSGVAVVAVVVIVVASMGAGVAAPVAVSTRNVKPDSSLYGLSRLGESIRHVSVVDQMKLRWGDYQSMVAENKGLEYQWVLDEFRAKMDNVIDKMPDNVAAKRDIIEWMQQQENAVKNDRLSVMKEACESIKGDLENQPEVGAVLGEMENEIENYQRELQVASPEQSDNIAALTYLIGERIRGIIETNKNSIRHPINIDVDNLLLNIDATIMAQENIPNENLMPRLQEKQANFENDLAEVKNNLQELPENARISTAVQSLINNAIKLDNRAIQAENENKLGLAFGLTNAADVMLANADRVLDSVTGYVENVQQFIDNGFLQEYQRFSQIVDNLPDTAYRTGLQNILELSQDAFNQGNYELAKWYLLRVEDFTMQLRQNMMPWTLPKPRNRR
jgi:hypothetical protein